VIHAVIERRPAVLASHRFWELSDDAVAVGIGAAASAHAPAEVWRSALAASEAGVQPHVWKRVPDAAAEPLARAILDELTDDPGHLHAAADVVLPGQARLVWSWLDRLNEPIEPAALLLARFTEVAEAAPAAGDSALRLARHAAQAPHHQEAADTVAAALLGVALTRQSYSSKELIEACFGRVHTGLEAGRLGQKAHAVLGRSLFPGASGVSADALRRRLVERYEAERWGWTPLVRAVAGGSVVEQLLRLIAPPKKGPEKKK
jgi:hypothetical protein